jgi:uncharacterized protein (TIGR03435 family)
MHHASGVSHVLLIAGGASAILAFGQAQRSAPRSEFAAASIRPEPGYGGSTLKNLIAGAYQVQNFQVSGGPNWAGSDRFNVTVTPDFPAVGQDQKRLMMRSLLEDRFSLSLHREIKQGSVYVLGVAKGGLKMKPSADQISPDVNGPAPPGAGPNRGVIRIGFGSLIGNAADMPLFVRLLSQRLERVVIDKTGLTGRFDFQAQWTPDIGETRDSPTGLPLPPARDDSGISVFIALQEQLGLKLESQKGSIETYVIDDAEKPSPN